MTSHTTLSSRVAQTARDLSIVPLVTKSTLPVAINLCDVLRFAQDDRK
jgi:hypothetical protein